MYKKYIVRPIHVPVKYWSVLVLKVSRAWAAHLRCTWRLGSDEGGDWYQLHPSHGPGREIQLIVRLNLIISPTRVTPSCLCVKILTALWLNTVYKYGLWRVLVDLQSGFSPVCQWLCWSSKAQSPLPHSRSILLWGKVYNTRNLPLLAYQSWSSSQSAVHKHFKNGKAAKKSQRCM